MRIALLGGTFNPLHIGHCMLADSVLCDLNYDKILFVPANIPPHKMMNETVSAEERFLMVEAFCKSAENYGTKRFFAEDCEMKRGGVSYTCDTLQYIIEKYGDKIDGKPALIMGQETAAQFYKWKNADKIAESADLIIARRNSDFNGIDTSGFTIKTDKPKRGMLSFYVDCMQKDGAVGHREILIYTAVFLQKGLSALQAEYPSHLSLQVVCARDCKYVKDGGI